MFKTEIHLLTSSMSIIYENALNCFVKDQMYCVLFEKDGKRIVHKYPFTNIFRVLEDYRKSQR